MSRVPYTALAREYLMRHSQVTAKLLDGYITEAGFEVRAGVSIAALNKLSQSGEATKQVVAAKNGRKHMLFTATASLGKVVNQVPPVEGPTTEGVLMLQSILGNIRANAKGQDKHAE